MDSSRKVDKLATAEQTLDMLQSPSALAMDMSSVIGNVPQNVALDRNSFIFTNVCYDRGSHPHSITCQCKMYQYDIR